MILVKDLFEGSNYSITISKGSPVNLNRTGYGYETFFVFRIFIIIFKGILRLLTIELNCVTSLLLNKKILTFQKIQNRLWFWSRNKTFLTSWLWFGFRILEFLNIGYEFEFETCVQTDHWL